MKSNGKIVFTAANVFLATLHVIYHFTDYSLAGTIPDMIFPLCVGLISLGSSFFLGFDFDCSKIILNSLSICLNIFLGIVPYVLLIIFAPIMLLGYLFSASESGNDRVVQELLSPDGNRVVQVIYHPVGAYTSGWGAYRMTLTSNTMPFIERDIYKTSSNYHGTEDSFVEWIDNDTLYIPENDEVVEIGVVKFSISNLLIFSLFPILVFIAYIANLFI